MNPGLKELLPEYCEKLRPLSGDGEKYLRKLDKLCSLDTAGGT
jgi:hypothetical protein